MVSPRKSWSPHAISVAMYCITTAFWYATGRDAAMRCGSNGSLRHSAILLLQLGVALTD